MPTKQKVLIVDDEPFNLDILTEHLESNGYKTVQATDGDVALQVIEDHLDTDVIVLDRMMPKMNGIEVVKTLKKDIRFKHIPIVMQTAAAQSHQVLEGIQAGVYYYLTKPYKEDILLSIVKAALSQTVSANEIKEKVKKIEELRSLMQQSSFQFRTLEEAKNLAYFISGFCPEPESAAYGLTELMVNAIEHGNLGITYHEKTALVKSNTLTEEITKRLNLDENKHKHASLMFETHGQEILVTIKDQGEGFDWQLYLDFSPERATDPHGRGIATAKMMSFKDLEYKGCGNEVVCTPIGKGGGRILRRLADRYHGA